MTPRQLAALTFIRDQIARHGFSPSFAEIADGLGLVSRGSAHRLIACLAERGYLGRETSAQGRRAAARALFLTEAGHAALRSQGASLPRAA